MKSFHQTSEERVASAGVGDVDVKRAEARGAREREGTVPLSSIRHKQIRLRYDSLGHAGRQQVRVALRVFSPHSTTAALCNARLILGVP